MSTNDIRELDFEPISERWNEYFLEDGTRIKGRLILLKLLGPKNIQLVEGAQLQAKTQNIFVVSAPDHLKGPPGPPLTPNEISSAFQKGVLIQIRESKEEWNEYRIIDTGQTFKMKLVASEIYRLPDRYDNEGQPVYVIFNTIAIAPGPARSRFPTP